MKATSDTKQETVQSVTVGSTVYVQIYLNETEKEVATEDGTKTVYEYDFNEFHAGSEDIDLADVKENPADYANYPLAKPTDAERISALEDAMVTLMGGE